MRLRTTLITLAIFLALGSYVYFYEMKGGEKRKAEKELSEKLLPFDKDSVTAIYLTKSGISLKKEDGKWTIVEPVRALTEEYTVTSIINSLEGATRDRLVAEQASEHATYGVGPTAAAIVLTHQGKNDTVFVGDKNPTGAFVFTRVNSGPQVYTTSISLQTNADKTLYDLRDKSAMVFEVNNVTRMRLKSPHATYEVRKEEGTWTLQQPSRALADESKVTQLLNRVRDGRVKRFIEEEPADLKQYGLDKPAYEMEIRFGSDDAVKTLRVGKAEKEIYYAHDSSRPPVFGLDSSLVRDLSVKLLDMRERRLTDFQSYDADEVFLEYPEKTIGCKKDTTGTWSFTAPDTGKVKSWKISEVTGAVSSLRAESFLDGSADTRAAGLETPRVKITIKTKGREVATLLIGKGKGDLVYAKGSLQPAVVLIKKAEADKLFITYKDLAEEVKS